MSLKVLAGIDHQAMVIDMNEGKHVTLAQVREFLSGTADVEFKPIGEHAERYRLIAGVMSRLRYRQLGRRDRGLVLRYLERVTGYSRQQLTRLVHRYLDEGVLRWAPAKPQAGFTSRFTAADVALLAEVDTLHNTLSGPATVVLCQRAFSMYGDARFERLATLSSSHLYNLRQRPRYRAIRRHFTKTRPTNIPIGVRRAPKPDGRPGFIRIDTVHQGDEDGIKGVYTINAVDCVSQWEVVACCERISEAHLLPVLRQMLEGFPFKILGVHTDNGSEFVNAGVARLLAKLNAEFTRSRPRHSNDNGLAESKNGAIVRKLMSYGHIPQKHAAVINDFYRQYLNPYLNLHRPSYFAKDVTDDKGRTRKTYPSDLIMTPLDRLAAIPRINLDLRSDVTLQGLQSEASNMTDNQAALRLNDARNALFKSFQPRSRKAA